MKAISPMIATVLLIAFTVAVGGILSIWLSSLTATQTTAVGTGGERMARCAASSLVVKEVRFACAAATSNIYVNVTVANEGGTEALTNVTLEVIGGGKSNTTTYVTTLVPGQSLSTSAIVNQSAGGPDCPFQRVRARSMCQTTVAIVGECKPGDTCWKV